MHQQKKDEAAYLNLKKGLKASRPEQNRKKKLLKQPGKGILIASAQFQLMAAF